MLSRSTLTIAAGALAALGFSACKTVYADTFSYKKNSFKAPPEKVQVVNVPSTLPIIPVDGALPGGGLPPGGGGIPGAPGPDAGAIPGMPGAAPAAPAVPGAPPPAL